MPHELSQVKIQLKQEQLNTEEFKSVRNKEKINIGTKNQSQEDYLEVDHQNTLQPTHRQVCDSHECRGYNRLTP